MRFGRTKVFLLALLAAGPASARYPAGFTWHNTTLRGDNFQSHNQKIVWTPNGLFRSGHFQNQTPWNEVVERSTDGGANWTVIWDLGYDNRPCNIEADADANVYVLYPNSGGSRFVKFSASNDYASPVVNRLHGQATSASKFASCYDAGRQRIYHATQWGYVFTFDLNGNFTAGRKVFTDGGGAGPSYPHLFVDENGIVHYAMTTADSDSAPYQTIRYLKSLDGGQSWKAMDGTAVSIPTTCAAGGPSTMINLSDEVDVGTWLSNMHVKNGKVHFAYRAVGGRGMHYMRFNATTGVREIDSSPNGEGWVGDSLRIDADAASFASDPDDPDGPLYAVGGNGEGGSGDGNRLNALVSYDNGATWHDYARSGWFSRIANPGLFRRVTPGDRVIGCLATSTPVWATVNYFELPAVADTINDAPAFSSDPVVMPDAVEGEYYTNNLLDFASDSNGDPITFSGTGPAWLAIDPSGAVTGTPGEGDLGLNQWAVQAVDGNGGTNSATLEITVLQLETYFSETFPTNMTLISVADYDNIATNPAATFTPSNGLWYGSSAASSAGNSNDGQLNITTGRSGDIGGAGVLLDSSLFTAGSGTYTINLDFVADSANYTLGFKAYQYDSSAVSIAAIMLRNPDNTWLVDPILDGVTNSPILQVQQKETAPSTLTGQLDYVEGNDVLIVIYGGQPNQTDKWRNGGCDNLSITKPVAVVLSPYEQWAEDNGLTPDVNDGPADVNNSAGINNLTCYGLGLNPMSGLADGGALPQLTGGPVYIVAQRNDETLSFKLLTTDDLVSGLWNTNNVGVEYTVSGTNTVGSFNYVTYAIDTADSKKFIRVLVEQL